MSVHRQFSTTLSAESSALLRYTMGESPELVSGCPGEALVSFDRVGKLRVDYVGKPHDLSC